MLLPSSGTAASGGFGEASRFPMVSTNGAARVPESLTASVLVLNRFYAPINVIPALRAFRLLYKETAEAIERDEDGNGFVQCRLADWLHFSQERSRNPGRLDQFVRTPRFAILVPRVIRLFECAASPRYGVKFTKRNVLVRDGHRCQYCGKRAVASRLTVDHVVPKVRGGRSVWTNVVTACADCNVKKGNKLPWEAGMRLIAQPGVPRRNPVLLDRAADDRYKIWLSFVREADPAAS